MIADLLKELEDKRIHLTYNDGRLKYVGPDNVITPEIIKKLKENKDALISYLRSGNESGLNNNSGQVSGSKDLSFNDAGQLYSYLNAEGYNICIRNAKLVVEHPQGVSNDVVESAIRKFYKQLYHLNWPIPAANLTPIQPEGSGEPFFIVHGEEATAFFQDIFGTDLPLFDYFHQSSDGSEMRYQRVEEVAEVYLNQLLSIKNEGKFYLAGYSFGGLVAYEMAQRLKQLGKKVEMLTIIDTSEPNYRGYDYSFRYYSVLRKFRLLVRDPLKLWFKSLYLRLYCIYILSKGEKIPPHLRPFYIVDNYVRNSYYYKPDQYDGNVYLITSLNNKFRHKDEYLGWKKYVKGNIDIIQVKGNHREIMQNPECVRQIAHKIKELIMGLMHHN